ncbi:MAG TPA: 50S ribosomal protein L11 methyltransferase [Patescibacteria group bacterium]
MLALILIFITLLILFFLLSMVWPPDSPWSPWWRTNQKIARIQCRLAKINKNDVVYDLGCGDGTALITAAKEFGAKGVGVEIDPLRFWIAKLRFIFNGLTKKLKVVRTNFFTVDVSSASVVIMYLIPKTLNRLKPKLLKELKPGTRIVTFVYQLELPLLARDEKNEVYVYQIPKLKK